MTTNYHTPLVAADLLTLLVSINGIASSLDSGITGILTAAVTDIQATAGEGLGNLNTAYLDLSDGQIYLMDADAATPKAGAIRGFVSGTWTTGQTATLVIGGALEGFSGLTVGEALYASTTGGGYTQTRPVPSSGGSQVAIAEMGIALAADTVLVRPQPIIYELRDAMVQNDELTIVHHDDDRGYARDVRAYITETVAGATLEEYTSGNQDVDVALRDRAPATYGSDLCTGGTPLGNLTDADGLAGVFDDDSGTYGTKNSSTTANVGYDFGAANDKTIRQYTIMEGGSAASAPKDWTFEYSDNNSDWTVAKTVTGETGWSNNEVRTFTVDGDAGSHRYWRVNVSDNNGGVAVSVGEVEMMEAATYTDGHDKLAQTVDIGASEVVGTLEIYYKKVGSPTGTVTVRVETVDGSNNPTGTLAHANATVTFDEADLAASYGTVTVNFTEFTPGAATYAIVVSTDRAASETDYIVWGADGSSPSYAGGEMKSYNGSSWSNESKDAIFAVKAPGIIHPSKVNVDWWSSALAEMTNRYGDGAGADLESKTTFKCVRSAGFDDVSVQVVLP